jgi:hypothetical protein
VSLTPRGALALYAAVLLAAVLTMLGSAATSRADAPGHGTTHAVSVGGGSVRV